MATATLPRKINSRKRGIRYKFRQMGREWNAYLFLAPGLILFSVFTVFALVYAFYLTFHEWNILQPAKPFVGLQNYRDMLHDQQFKQSVINTAYFTGGSIPLTMAIGLGVALLLNQPLRFRGLFRTMYFLPVVTPFVASAILWKWLYNGDYGLFNFYLLKLHLIQQPLLFLSSKNLAMPSVILMAIWGGV
ncbi:MAG: multiple sugar transport system permease protein, partial [Nocardioidaceae bacterium]|nr:multiple sugar transport system permease protein [Nocardioidaceae bacterium]